MNFICKRLSIS